MHEAGTQAQFERRRIRGFTRSRRIDRQLRRGSNDRTGSIPPVDADEKQSAVGGAGSPRGLRPMYRAELTFKLPAASRSSDRLVPVSVSSRPVVQRLLTLHRNRSLLGFKQLHRFEMPPIQNMHPDSRAQQPEASSRAGRIPSGQRPSRPTHSS